MSKECECEHKGGDRGRGVYYGDTARAFDAGDVLITESTYYKDQQLPRHAHELAFFCLCLDGAYDETYVYRSNSFEPFSLVYHPPSENHACTMCSADVRVLNIEVTKDCLEHFETYAKLPDNCVDDGRGELVWLAGRVFAEFRTADACSPAAVEGLVLEMLAAAARSRDTIEHGRPKWFEGVIDRLKDEYAEPPSVSAIARDAGVHPVHLSRTFRRQTGTTVGDFVRRLRVRHACSSLMNPQASLADVALAAGFADQSHLTRIFKQMLGLTPGLFQRKVC